MAEPSLGAGLGLQYSMPSSAGIINQLRQARREEAAMLAEVRKRRAKEQDEQDKFAEDASKISVSGVIPFYADAAKTEAAKVLNYLNTHRGENLRGNTEFEKLRIEAVAKIKDYQDLSNRFYDQASKADGQKFKLNEKLSKAALSSPDDIVDENTKETARDVWNAATQGSGIYTHGVLEPIDNTSWLEEMQKNVVGSGLKYKSIVDPVTKTKMSLQAPSEVEVEKTWSVAKMQPWYDRAMTQQIALGVDPAVADAQIKQVFITSIPKDVSPHSMEPKKSGGLALNFDGNTAENDNVRVVVTDTDDRRIYNIAQIKTTENSILDFSRPKDSSGNVPVIRGTPLRIEKLKNGQSNIVVSVPEIVDDEKTGKFTEERVPYELNKDRVLAGKLNFTIEDIDKGITEKGVQKKEGDKFIQKKMINGVERSVYQRPDGSKYAK